MYDINDSVYYRKICIIRKRKIKIGTYLFLIHFRNLFLDFITFLFLYVRK